MADPILDFWFDFASTYSYLAAARIRPLAAEAKVQVRFRPFLLGPIFKAQGWDTSPFNLYEAKGRYMWRDMERLCEKYEIPFRRPSKFPRSGLLAPPATRQDPERHAEKDDERHQREEPHDPAPARRDPREKPERESRIHDERQGDEALDHDHRDARRQAVEHDQLGDLVENDDDGRDRDDASDTGPVSADRRNHSTA